MILDCLAVHIAPHLDFGRDIADMVSKSTFFISVSRSTVPPAPKLSITRQTLVPAKWDYSG